MEGGYVTYYLRSSVLGGKVIAELDGWGSWQRGYVYLGSQLLALQQGSAVEWVHQDPVVKSQRLTDAAGTITAAVELDPWGGETNRSFSQWRQPQRYTSYLRDGNESDEAMHRRYNRWWGRFDQPDPYDGSYDLTDPQSFNRYAYVQNDPVNYTDPAGLDPRFGQLPIEYTGGQTNEALIGMIQYLFQMNLRLEGAGSWYVGWFPPSALLGGGWTEPLPADGGGGVPLNPTPQEDTRTGCQRFADMVAEIAGRNDTAEGFMDEMARPFTAANNSSREEIRRNADRPLPPGRVSISDDGFRENLRDGTGLQVRHFVGGLLYGYRYGYGTMAPATALEAISPAPSGSWADVRLNEFSMRWGTSMEPRPASVTSYMGATIRTPAHPGYRGLADLIRRDICQ